MVEFSYYLGWVIGLIFLLITAIFDGKSKEIPLGIILCGELIGALLFLGQYVFGRQNVWNEQSIFGGMNGNVEMSVEYFVWLFISCQIPGIGLLILAYLTKRKIGTGDGMILSTMGFLLGCDGCFRLLYIGLCLQSLFIILLFCVRKAKKDSRVPFVPFLAIAHLLLFI